MVDLPVPEFSPILVLDTSSVFDAAVFEFPPVCEFDETVCVDETIETVELATAPPEEAWGTIFTIEDWVPEDITGTAAIVVITEVPNVLEVVVSLSPPSLEVEKESRSGPLNVEV